jgi:hypothetical protein
MSRTTREERKLESTMEPRWLPWWVTPFLLGLGWGALLAQAAFR